jgi:hypothetical protein
LIQLPSPNGAANKETKPEAAATESAATETAPEPITTEEPVEVAKTETAPEAESDAAAAKPTEGEKSKIAHCHVVNYACFATFTKTKKNVEFL